MPDSKPESLKVLLNLLKRFLQGESGIFKDSFRQDTFVYHYYKEIIRYWSKLNFIIRKTQRALKLKSNLHFAETACLLYATYRIFWEGAPNDEIQKEITLPHSEIKPILEKIPSFSWEIALKNKSEEEKLSILEAFPTFFIKRLNKVMSLDQLKMELKSLNNKPKQGEFTVFIKKEVSQVLDMCFINRLQRDINQNNPIFKVDEHLPFLYHVSAKFLPEILSSELYLSGNLIILDKASAAVVEVFQPKKNRLILDMCAAPGIKTSLISHLTNKCASIFANDFSKKRSITMKGIVEKLQNPQMHLINSDGILLPLRNEERMDQILLDAPCTGSGALYTNPELKWRQSREFLYQNVTLQEKLLDSALNYLKPSGILVYSTCSLYPEEGEYQIQKFIDRLIPMQLPSWMSSSYPIDGKNIPGTARLFPSTHHCEGFFIGKFKKKE
ncbi:MAG: RsmB/NOP family class I SAM-dependent RNA methyltransferase, partial [Promethearchaeota archaeon]